MKTKEKGGKKGDTSFSEFVGWLILTLIVFSVVLSILFIYTSVRYTSNMVTLHSQIANLTNIINLNESQVIFNKPISIGSSRLIGTPSLQLYVANITLHFNFTHAGYIVINTTGQSYIGLVLMQNYSKTWLGVNDSGVWGNFNYSVRSLTMPVLPGPATLILLNDVYSHNTTNTTPYKARLTITYHS